MPLYEPASSGGSPGGSNTQVQFNDSSAFGGDADLVWNKTTNALTAGKLVLAGTGTGPVLDIADTGYGGGATIKLTGDGATTPSKTIRARVGTLEIMSDTLGANLFTLTDAGAITLSGLTGAGSRMVTTDASGVLGAAAIPAAPAVVSLASDATANSTTTGVEITGLNKTTGTGTFHFKYAIRYTAGATGTGVKFGVNHTGTAAVFMANMNYQPTGGAATTHNQAITSPGSASGASTRTKSTTAPNLGPTGAVDASDSDMFLTIEGLIIVTVDGDLELWHASEVAAISTVKAGSSLILTKTS